MTEKTHITTTLVKCPSCGIENKVAIYSDQLRGKTLVCCDVEIGGCDEQFAYSVDFSIETETFKLVKTEN
jgi:hypothetical protein